MSKITITSADGTTLAARCSGRGSPLVLVHGGNGDLDTFRLIEGTLAEQHTVWVYSRRGRGGSGEAFRLGVAHGLFCLGCCWALMLVLFAIGVGELLWMAGLTAVMVVEKVARGEHRLAPVVGVALLVWSAFVAAQPAWLPAVFGGA